MDQVLQQLVNAVSLGSIYALIALGYTMVYGIIQLINFAHGEVVMIGAMTAYSVIVALTGAQRQAAAAGLRRGQVVRAVVSFQGIDASGGRSATVVRSVRITG